MKEHESLMNRKCYRSKATFQKKLLYSLKNEYSGLLKYLHRVRKVDWQSVLKISKNN